MIGAGEMNQRVTLLSATATRDAYGAEVLAWVAGATVHARIIERGGREPVLADRPVMVMAYEVVIRAGLTVTHLDRLTWGAKTLQIDTVTPQPTGFLTLRCLEVDA